jgi:hypothetical protein
MFGAAPTEEMNAFGPFGILFPLAIRAQTLPYGICNKRGCN